MLPPQILIADLYEISQEWKLCVDAISVIVGLTPTVNDAISEAQDIASIFIKILAAATGNPAAILHLLYTGYKVLNNSKHLFKLYDESGRFVESMLVIEHFVLVVMDVIKRGYNFYKLHFGNMEKKERSDARKLAKEKGQKFKFEPEWSKREDHYPDQKPNTLYIGLSRARDLAVKDHYIMMRGGTSDPRAVFKLNTPAGKKVKKSSTKLRTLKPQWNEEFKFDLVPPDESQILSKMLFSGTEEEQEEEETAKDPDKATKPEDVEIPDLRPKKEDDDMKPEEAAAPAEDPKGRRGKPLRRHVPEDVKAKRQLKEWQLVCDLEDVDLTSSSESLGRVTIDLLPLRNHKLSRTWHLLKKKPKYAEKATKKVTDKNHASKKHDTENKNDGKKDDGKKDDGTKKDEEEDYQSFSVWDDDGDDDGKISGDVELLLRWVYEPDADDWQPPFCVLDPGTPATYNEVRIGLFRARNLPAMDDNVLTADSSDPTFKFSIEPNFPVEGAAKPKLYVSSTKYQTLFPVFKEVITIRGGPWGLEGTEKVDDYKLSIACEDHDTLSASDPMGTCDVPLKDLVDGKVMRKWFHLELPEGVVPVNAEDIKKAGSPPAEVELFLQLAYNPNPPEPRRVPQSPACLGWCGAPPQPELFDGLEAAPCIVDDASTLALPTSSAMHCSTDEVLQAQRNALVLARNLGTHHKLLTQLVADYRSFLTNPRTRQTCANLATSLGAALDENQKAAAGRSLRTARANNGRFPLRVTIHLPIGFSLAGRARTVASSRLCSSVWNTGYLAVKWTKRAPLGAPPSADGDDGSKKKKKVDQDEVPPSIKKTRKTSANAASDFMSSLESGLLSLVQDIVNVTELYNDLTRMNANWNDVRAALIHPSGSSLAFFAQALKALAFVENAIPKIVSSLEVIQSIVQVILKAIQGISFPPNPAVRVCSQFGARGECRSSWTCCTPLDRSLSKRKRSTRSTSPKSSSLRFDDDPPTSVTPPSGRASQSSACLPNTSLTRSPALPRCCLARMAVRAWSVALTNSFAFTDGICNCC